MEHAQLMKRSRPGPHEAPGATLGAVGNVLTTPAFFQRNRAEPELNRWKLRGKRPHEALSAMLGAMGSVLTKPAFFYKRNRAEPERNRWKLQGKHPTHETEPDGTGGGTGPFP